MHASIARRALGGIVPPKFATPKIVSGGSGEGLAPLVQFYSKLPKGPAPKATGLKARFFNGANASSRPLVLLLAGIFGIGYVMDYQMHLKHHKNHAH